MEIIVYKGKKWREREDQWTKKNNIMKIIVYKRKKWRERWDQ
jgi:hypothetical protein